MSEIAVIIATYNGEKWIRTCLDNLMRSQQSVKVIVVDNASTDGTKEIIKEHSLKIKLIEKKENLGFGQANNIGIKCALKENAAYVFLLNQDAYVYPDTIGKLLHVHQKNTTYGIISPVQLNGSGKKLDPAFECYITNNYPYEFVQKINSSNPDLPQVFPIRFVNAAAWFISRSCIEKVGFFHPLFYHYGEDNNYSSRVQYHGFKVGITPSAHVCHDRVSKQKTVEYLLKKIKLEPLYILLDIRKNIFLVYVLSTWKLIGFAFKGIKRNSSKLPNQAFQQMRWSIKNGKEIRKARKEMKTPYLGKVSTTI